MLRDESEASVSGGDGGGSASMTWRALRRKLPLGRGATLVVDGRTHIVGLADVSTTGAYLITRTHARVGEEYVLGLFVLPGPSELTLRVRVVRVVQSGQEKDHHPLGLAVQFVGVDDAERARLELFVKAGLGR
jgi:Tfp pilus assembly protein PilZ